MASGSVEHFWDLNEMDQVHQHNPDEGEIRTGQMPKGKVTELT